MDDDDEADHCQSRLIPLINVHQRCCNVLVHFQPSSHHHLQAPDERSPLLTNTAPGDIAVRVEERQPAAMFAIVAHGVLVGMQLWDCVMFFYK